MRSIRQPAAAVRLGLGLPSERRHRELYADARQAEIARVQQNFGSAAPPASTCSQRITRKWPTLTHRFSHRRTSPVNLTSALRASSSARASPIGRKNVLARALSFAALPLPLCLELALAIALPAKFAANINF